MKKILPYSAALILMLTGCILSSEKYKSPATYDLSAERLTCSNAVNGIRVRNSSGADRRFLYRVQNNRMQFDEYNFWMLPPEQLVRRIFDVSFSKRGRNAADIVCSIERFEFDLTSNSAILELSVTVEKNGRSRHEFLSVTQKFANRSGSDAACAMDKCVKEAVKKVNDMITVFTEKEKDGK